MLNLIAPAAIGGTAGAAVALAVTWALRRARWQRLESIVQRERAMAAYQHVFDKAQR